MINFNSSDMNRIAIYRLHINRRGKTDLYKTVYWEKHYLIVIAILDCIDLL